MGKQFERFIGVYEIEIMNGNVYLYFQIPGLEEKPRKLMNPSVETLARILHFYDIRPVHFRDGEFMGKYILTQVMNQPCKKLFSK